MSKFFALLAVISVCALSACEESPAPVVASPVVAPTQAAPVIVQQPSNDGFFTGMLMGHMMSGGGHSYSRNTTVINKSYTTVNRSYVAPRSSYSYGVPFRSNPTGWSRSSSFGSFRGGRR